MAWLELVHDTEGTVTRRFDAAAICADEYLSSVSDTRLVLIDDPTQSEPERARVAEHVSRFGLAQVYRICETGTEGITRGRALAQALANSFSGEPVLLGAMSREAGLRYWFPRGYFGKAGEMPPQKLIRARDGSRIGYREYGESHGTTFVLLHGATTHDALYAPLARFLAARKVGRVLALTLRGHGAMYEREGDVDYVGQCEDDVLDVIGVLRRQRPDERIVLVGHSLGGGLAMRVATGVNGQLIDGMVLLSPYLGMFTPLRKASISLLDLQVHWWRGGMLTLLNVMRVRRWNGARLVDFGIPKELLSALETTHYSFRMWNSLSPSEHLQGALNRVKCPLLVLLGQEDEVLDVPKYLVRLRSADRAMVKVIPKAMHLGIVFQVAAQREMERWVREHGLAGDHKQGG